MLVGLNAEGKRTYVEEAKEGEPYFCPTCGEKLVLKKGQVRCHHFSHPPHSHCSDGWHYDMSDWHTHWQARFPIECQEIVKRIGDKTHRADVLIEGCKTVIEFQHSPLAPEEFEDRNSFYNKLGYKVIWVFDVVDAFWKESLREISHRNWRWGRPKSTFALFDPICGDVVVFLQLFNEPEDDETLQSIVETRERMGADDACDPEMNNYYDEHKDASALLVKVISAGNGFRFLKTDGSEYDLQTFLNSFSSFTTLQYEMQIGRIFDDLPFLGTKDHTTYYSGCPISSSHKCADSTIDIPESKYSEIRPCSICEFGTGIAGQCRKRVADANIPLNAKILGYEKKNRQVTSVRYSVDGVEKVVDLAPSVYSSEKPEGSLFELWGEHNLTIATFQNSRTGIFVRLTKDPQEMQDKYGKVYGVMSHDQYDFRGKQSQEIYYAYKKEWVLVWKGNK